MADPPFSLNARPSGTRIYRQLAEASDRLDRLLRNVGTGIGGPSHYDSLETEANAIGAALRAAFRERSAHG